MASYTVTTGSQFGAWEKSLSANAVDTVTLAGVGRVEVTVVNVSGAASIYFTVNGPTPVVGASESYWLPATAGAMRTVSAYAAGTSSNVVVRLVSSGAPTYSVDAS